MCGKKTKPACNRAGYIIISFQLPYPPRVEAFLFDREHGFSDINTVCRLVAERGRADAHLGIARAFDLLEAHAFAFPELRAVFGS